MRQKPGETVGDHDLDHVLGPFWRAEDAAKITESLLRAGLHA
jgi:hypothetical protein